MKQIEHISAMTGDRKFIQVANILPKTRAFFAKVVEDVSAPVAIPETPFTLRVTIDGDVALFDLMKGEYILTSNLCCFSAEGRAVATKLSIEYNKLPFSKAIVEPATPHFLYSYIIMPQMATIADMMLAGEIEGYIYFSLYEKVVLKK